MTPKPLTAESILEGTEIGWLRVVSLLPHGKVAVRCRCDRDATRTVSGLRGAVRQGFTPKCSFCRVYVKPIRRFSLGPTEFAMREDGTAVGYIPSKDARFVVDACDLPMIGKYRWFLNNRGYISCFAPVTREKLLLHRVIMRAERGQVVDHADGDKTNNTRSNLRFATHGQNKANSGPARNNTSGYKGVSWCKASSKWKAVLRTKPLNRHLGHFDDINDAARAYDVAAVAQWGKFARLNFPEAELVEHP